MTTDRFLSQLAFLKWADKLKTITRKSRIMDGSRQENSAEHSWHLMLTALLLSEHANAPIDILRVLKMLAIHDLVEIECGDVFHYHKTEAVEHAEQLAAQRIFRELPTDQAQEYLQLWQEFEAKESDDAKFAAAIDRMWPIIFNFQNNGGTWKEFDMTLDQALGGVSHIGDGSTILWDYIEKIHDRAVEAGHLRRQ